MASSRYHHPESYSNGLSSNRSLKINSGEDSSKNRANSDELTAKLQSALLKRQQSLGYDKYVNIQVSHEPNTNNRGSIKTSYIHNNTQLK